MRPSNPTPITYADCHPCDIILSAGKDWLDDIIKIIDQSPYSHTTLFVENNQPLPTVIEATTKGIEEHPMTLDIEIQTIVDVYRWYGADGVPVGSPNYPSAPVLAEARTFVGGPYCYSELLMGALAILLVDESDSPAVKEAVRIWGAQIEYLLEAWFQGNSGKTPMTCVQVATSAYYKADPSNAHKYGINVRIDGSRHGIHFPDHVHELRKAKSKIRSMLFNESAQTEQGFLVKAGSRLLPLGTCTPRDMMDSPSLRYVGTLKDEAHGIKPPGKRGA